MAELVGQERTPGHSGGADRDDAPSGNKRPEIVGDPGGPAAKDSGMGIGARVSLAPIASNCSETEKITAGKWVGHVDYHPGDTVPVSVEQEIAKDLRPNDWRRARLRCAGSPDQSHESPACARSIGNVFRRTSSSSFPLACWKTRPLLTSSSVACRLRRLPRDCKTRSWQNSQCFRARSHFGHSNRGFDPRGKSRSSFA